MVPLSVGDMNNLKTARFQHKLAEETDELHDAALKLSSVASRLVEVYDQDVAPAKKGLEQAQTRLRTTRFEPEERMPDGPYENMRRMIPVYQRTLNEKLMPVWDILKEIEESLNSFKEGAEAIRRPYN